MIKIVSKVTKSTKIPKKFQDGYFVKILTVSRKGRCSPKNFPPLNMIGGPEKLVSKVCNYKIRRNSMFNHSIVKEKVIPLPSVLLQSSSGFGRLPAKPRIHLTPRT